jgi:hypothetical protein
MQATGVSCMVGVLDAPATSSERGRPLKPPHVAATPFPPIGGMEDAMATTDQQLGDPEPSLTQLNAPSSRRGICSFNPFWPPGTDAAAVRQAPQPSWQPIRACRGHERMSSFRESISSRRQSSQARERYVRIRECAHQLSRTSRASARTSNDLLLVQHGGSRFSVDQDFPDLLHGPKGALNANTPLAVPTCRVSGSNTRRSSEDSERMHFPRSFMQCFEQPEKGSISFPNAVSCPESALGQPESVLDAQTVAESMPLLERCRLHKATTGHAEAVLALLESSQNLQSCLGSETDSDQFSDCDDSDTQDAANSTCQEGCIPLAACFSSALYAPASCAAMSLPRTGNSVDGGAFGNLLNLRCMEGSSVDMSGSTGNTSSSNVLGSVREVSQDVDQLLVAPATPCNSSMQSAKVKVPPPLFSLFFLFKVIFTMVMLCATPLHYSWQVAYWMLHSCCSTILTLDFLPDWIHCPLDGQLL